MNTQLKKGFLEFCILAALCEDDSYGYQIIKDVSGCIKISESTLYPILKRLESSGYLDTYTEKGRDHIREFLDEWQQIMGIYEFVKGAAEHE